MTLVPRSLAQTVVLSRDSVIAALSVADAAHGFGPFANESEDRMAAFTFKLEHADGTPADPATLKTAVPNWQPSDTIPLGGRTLRVVAVVDHDADRMPVLVVEDRR
jgi:hypothetical protein